MDKQKLQEAGKSRFIAMRATNIDEEKRTAEFVISSEAVDTYNTVFMSDGWDFERYAKNPVVFFQHGSWSSDPDSLIGTSEIRQEGDKTIGVVTFESAEINPLAEKVFRKVIAGTLRGASINARVHEGHFGDFDNGENPDVLYFTRQELLEWSIVTLPSNPDALKRQHQTVKDLRAEENTPPKPDNTSTRRSIKKARIINNQNRIQ